MIKNFFGGVEEPMTPESVTLGCGCWCSCEGACGDQNGNSTSMTDLNCSPFPKVAIILPPPA